MAKAVVDKETGEVLDEKSLVVTDTLEKELANHHIIITPYALKFDGQLTEEDWHKAVLGIQKYHGMLQWYLGDLAVYAESEHTGWGESKYDELVAATGYDNGTLRNFATISRRFTPTFRKAILSPRGDTFNVSFNHFRVVSPLDDNVALYWLRKAGENGWGVAKLREQLNKEYPKEERHVDEEEIPDGWVPVKELGIKNVVRAPEYRFGDDYYSENDHVTAAIQLYKYEIENLLEMLDEDDRFVSLHDRLETALAGL